MEMEILLYQISLVLAAIANLAMAAGLLANQKKYANYPVYSRARLMMILWLAVFAVGYMLHFLFMPRINWPAAASALTVSYFHWGAICFCWGFIPLLNPDFLTRRRMIWDIVIYAVGLACYWTVPLLWREAPLATTLSYLVFFIFCGVNVVVFYKTYNRVCFRLVKMSYGNVSGFVRWMQASCDLILLFGIGSVAIVAIFPNDFWPFTALEIVGTLVYAYIVYSLSHYGSVIETASRATENVAAVEMDRNIPKL
jgi:hypothetical protein